MIRKYLRSEEDFAVDEVPLAARRFVRTKNGIMQAIPELLDEAERCAGRECDNLSVIALTWE